MSERLRQALAAGEEAGSRYVLRAPRRLPVGVAGGRQGARAGSSLEFREHREYEPGDDLRHIDWNAYARSDQLVVKLFHEEVTPHLDLVLDGSRSMALDGTLKAEAAGAACAFLAAAAVGAGMSHRVWTIGESCTQLEGSRNRPVEWALPTFDYADSAGAAFARRPPPLRPRGLRALVSDLLWLGDPMQVLGPLAERATAVVVLQLLAKTDAEPPERGNLRIVDHETGETIDLLVDEATAARYRERLTRHQKAWAEACRRVGAMFAPVIAEDFMRTHRLDALVEAEVLQFA